MFDFKARSKNIVVLLDNNIVRLYGELYAYDFGARSKNITRR